MYHPTVEIDSVYCAVSKPVFLSQQSSTLKMSKFGLCEISFLTFWLYSEA